jgi:hypothetical protein
LRGGVVGEWVGVQGGEAAGDLASTGAGEQSDVLDVDAGVDECGG